MDVGDVDAIMLDWRQGDCVLGEHWFAYRVHGEEVDLREDPVDGFVMLTQTCDIVRSSAVRPVLEVCPLVEVDEKQLQVIERGYRPRYAYVAALASKRLVADLDRVMTVEKRSAAGWERVPGWASDAEARRFASAIGRKRTRFAFPDDFNELAGKLQDRIIEKHGRDSAEGRALRALREIRVQAAPSWDASEVAVLLLFIRENEQITFEGGDWETQLEKWLRLVPSSGRFTVDGQVTSLQRITADDYVHSDILDLDHLSGPIPPRGSSAGAG